MFAKAVFIFVVCSAALVTSYPSSKVGNIHMIGKVSTSTSSTTTSTTSSTSTTTNPTTSSTSTTTNPTTSTTSSTSTTTNPTTSTTSSTSTTTNPTTATTTTTTVLPTTAPGPVTSAPATSAPATSAPATSAPATSAPATSAPATSAPATSAPTTSAPSGNCKCGEKSVSRIVGGKPTIPNEFPWMAALQDEGTTFPFCGGTVISSKTIVTAAHCIEDSNFKVVLGQHNVSTFTSPVTTHTVETILVHPGYNKDTNDNDIALIRITPPIDFNSQSKIVPACLPDDLTVTYADMDATVTGWGTLTSGGKQPQVLHEVVVPVKTNLYCESIYNMTPNMLCAGYAAGGKDSCQGDSGGPLVAADGSNYELIGVVSFGYKCAKPNFPGVYARVTKYVPWINEFTATGKDQHCPRT